MLFIIFAVLTILATAKRHEVQGQTRRWAAGIAAFILIIVASYAMTLAIGLSIGAASNHTTKLDGLISTMHHPVAGPFVSQLVAAPTTILALIFIPRLVFRLAAKTQPRLQSSEPQDTSPRSEPRPPKPPDDQSFQHNSNAPRPAKKPSTVVAITITVFLCLTLGAVVTAATFIIVTGEKVGEDITAEMPREPIATPPPTASPTQHPTRARRWLSPPPTIVPTPISTPPPTNQQPTPEPFDAEAAIIEAFASCNGKYQEPEFSQRVSAAQFTISGGYRSLQEVADIVNQTCPGALDAHPPELARQASPRPTPAEQEPDQATIAAYASCNGTYEGTALEYRYQYMQSMFRSENQTTQSLQNIIAERCQPQPVGIAAVPQTTPIPTSTPVPTSSRPPTPAPTPARAFTLQAPAPTPTLVKFSTEKIFATPQAPQRDTFQGLRNALWTQQKHPALANQIKAIPWVADGLEPLEADIVEELIFLAVAKQPDAAGTLAAMPFLHSPDPADLSAIKSLATIARRTQTIFHQVMNHTTVRAGITEDWTPVIATLSSPADNNPSLIDDLLNLNTVNVENRTINLPQAGTVTLSIVRTSLVPRRTMDLLEHAVRSSETFMTEPFPTRHVSLLFADSTSPGSSGSNYESHIVIRKEYDVDNGTHQADYLPNAIAHEVAHYYWSGNANWIDEGMSDLIASVSKYLRDGTPVAANRRPCQQFNSIARLEATNPSKSQASFRCNYALGQRLFLELLHDFGDADFRSNIAHLYRSSLPEDQTLIPGTKVGIKHLKSIFGNSRQGPTIIERWYYGTQPFDISNIDQSPPTNRLDTVHGKVSQADLVLQLNGSPVTSFSRSSHSGPAYFILQYSTNVQGGPYLIPITVLQYYGDGHVFDRRTIHIEADEKHNGSTWTRYIPVGPPSGQWNPGQYWAMIYDRNQKAAQIYWTVQP